MEPFVAMLEVEIFENNNTFITYKDASGLLHQSFASPILEQLNSVLYNSHLRSIIPDLIAGSGRRKNKIELVMTHQIIKALGFEDAGEIMSV